MRIIGAKEKIYTRYSVQYKFDEINNHDGAIRTGVLICYLITQNQKIEFITFRAEAEHEEIGVPLAWEVQYDRAKFHEKFPSFSQFAKRFNKDGVGIWKLKVIYDNTELTITGWGEEDEISVSYSVEESVDIFPLLSEIEKTSYNFQ